jgi:DNA polymerase gamma 1
MVTAPRGYALVGADVDSEEQWLAALMGDAQTGERRVGATPFSRMQLLGAKADGTDLHSVIANEVGISREHAKVINYARLYGSGAYAAAMYLQQQGIPAKDAKAKANHLFEKSKGKLISVTKVPDYLHQHMQEYVERKTTNGELIKNCDYFLIGNAYYLATERFETEFADRLKKREKRERFELYTGGM